MGLNKRVCFYNDHGISMDGHDAPAIDVVIEVARRTRPARIAA
ncbi:MAG: hypothetical protein NZL99_09485 [Burkholderiaceae bacterium]|nr:hypothetical protein [Burkholderiaceae bacterium]